MKCRYRFNELERGQQIIIEGADIQLVRSQANQFGKKYEVLIISTQTDNGVRVWRVR